MWILFAPSEKKILTNLQEYKKADFYKNLICSGTKEAVESYVKFLQTSDEGGIKKLFGTKSLDLESLALAQNCLNAPLLPAIIRYSGVAFSALDFKNLDKNAQDFIYKHTLIFSNLFGILRANDGIPFYDLKQGEGFKLESYSFKTQDFYKQSTKEIWDFLSQDSTKELEFLDLRASFYQKCFPLDKSPLKQKIKIATPIFIKNGKTLSHYAKFYRGILLKTSAKFSLKSIDDLENLHIEGLNLQEIKIKENKNIKTIELIYTIKS
ncbi:MAG: peroxide stress protein YaaA [Helicobacter sp.]|nr:peroxide stress protein YaaA [Helicobacteraceae bacterium]MDY3113683.1 peroxide stress protein YaaA [Helicobacter sp.]